MKKTILGIAILGICFVGCTTTQEALKPDQVIYLKDAQKDTGSESLYGQEQAQLTRNLIKTPPIPIKTPNTILTLLFYPHDDDGTLIGHFYAFMEINDGKWVVGNYLNKQKDGEKIITPLSLAIKTTETTALKEKEEIKNEQNPAQQGMKIPTVR